MSGSSSTTRMRWLAGLVGTRSFGSARCKVAQPTRAWQFSAHHVRAPGAPRRRATARPPSVAMIRVFVNERPVSVAPGARVRDAVEQLDHELAELVGSGAAYVTDGVGRPVDGGDPVGEGGAIFRVVVSARQGPPRLSKELLRRWLKAELHVHLDGCLRPETMLELGRVQGIRLPADTPEGLARALSVKHAKSLEEYLTKYEITLSVMQTAAALERVAYEFVLDVAADGVRYVEVRYSPLLHRPALTLAQAIEAPLAGIKRAETETGTKVGLIVCAIRTRRRTAWRARATPGKGTGRTRSRRRCTSAARGGSGTAPGWGRSRPCSTRSSRAASRSRCASPATSTRTRWPRSRSIRSSGISIVGSWSRSIPTAAWWTGSRSPTSISWRTAPSGSRDRSSHA